MRILLTTHAFLPRSVAGVEVYTARLASALQDLGHVVRVLTAVHDLGAQPCAVRHRTLGSLEVTEIVSTHQEGTLEATYRLPALDRSITEVLQAFQPDCVHVQHLLNLSTGLFQAARQVGARLLLTLHDYWLSCPRDGLRMQVGGSLCGTVDHRICAACLADSPYLVAPLQRGASHVARAAGVGHLLHRVHDRAPRLTTGAMRFVRRIWPVPPHGLELALDARTTHLRAAVSEADLILAPTRFARDRALEFGLPAGKLRLMPLGAIVGSTRARRAGPRRRLGYVGTLVPHKGAHVLLEAVRQLSGSDWTLELVGNPAIDPAYSARLRVLADGDPRICFRGTVPPDQQGQIWDSLDVLVLPSLWWENSPLTLLEALAAGVPVIASRTGGVPEILPEAAGLLVPPGDVSALRAALEGVIEGRHLAEALDPLPLKTALEGARELATVYAGLPAPPDRRP
jgi:glycosyltransferase involved in cell wall biosynthesis